MANEPLKGVAPQVQRPVVPQSAQTVQEPVPAAATTAQAAPVTAQAVEPTRDRTQENFDKLIESNNRLFQQNQANNVLIQQLLQQPPVQQPQQPVTTAPAADPFTDFTMKDPTTGEEYIDRQKMQNAFSTMRQQIEQANQAANSARTQAQQAEKDRQDREAFNAYPELNRANQGFDPIFERNTRAFLTDSMLNAKDYGGRPLSFREAADLVRSGARPTQQQVVTSEAVAQVEPQAPQQAANAAPTAAQINKAQASASVANQPPAAASELSEDQLQEQRVATRRGDDAALVERMMHTDHIFGPNSGTGEEPR